MKMECLDLPGNVRIVSQLPPSHPAFDTSDERSMRALSDAEERHFWFRSRNQLIAQRLIRLGILPPARLLDIGCGGGGVTAWLARLGYRVTGVDGHPALLKGAARRIPSAQFVVLDLRQGLDGLGETGFDAAGLFDVLEHLDDPAQALKQAMSAVRKDGLVIGTVPASERLWSEVDVRAGHRCRYEKATLHKLLLGITGAAAIEIKPFNRHLLPIMLVQRWLVRRKRGAALSAANLWVPPAPIDRAMGLLAGAERMLSPALDSLPFPGASLWFALRSF